MVDFINTLNGWLWGTPLIVLMFGAGIYFTVASGFFQFRHLGWIFKRTICSVFKKNAEVEGKTGMLKPFETACIAIGGTVGFGNIAGVATAVATGGPGAIFWMWVCALTGMIINRLKSR
ncbi:alanine:cation symporter family protein [uncultured Cloacibacillus sp.]|uniref:alanine:cation symporter family protein n=1 Tax=uncultured Cloacibacillus sp. TaxID=889794 RepID=UPI0026DCB41C|nr:alanine:cation symporter family protein [uncultured Cloacibacillus sp.]